MQRMGGDVYIIDNMLISFEGYKVPLYVKDLEVDRLAERLASLRRVSKTEVVRQALRHELEREEARPSLVEKGVAFVQALKVRRNRPRPAQPTRPSLTACMTSPDVR